MNAAVSEREQVVGAAAAPRYRNTRAFVSVVIVRVTYSAMAKDRTNAEEVAEMAAAAKQPAVR